MVWQDNAREMVKDAWAAAVDLVTLPLGRGAREMRAAAIKQGVDPAVAKLRVAGVQLLGVGVGVLTGAFTGEPMGALVAAAGIHVGLNISNEPFKQTGNPMLPRIAARMQARGRHGPQARNG